MANKPRRKPGRPRLTEDAQKRRQVNLSDFYTEKARRIGVGNVSRGIRLALDSYREK